MVLTIINQTLQKVLICFLILALVPCLILSSVNHTNLAKPMQFTDIKIFAKNKNAMN